jgi:hypothetical protein
MTARRSCRFEQYLLPGALLFVACQPVQGPGVARGNGSVSLTITAAAPMSGSDANATTWLARCGAEKFLINLIIPPADVNEPISFTTGKLCRYQEADAGECLVSIARALEAKKVEPPPERVDCLPFQAGILGQNLSRGVGKTSVLEGSFTSDSPGTWLATKAFVADGEGEFYLNLSPKTGEAEISIKDPEYGDVVIGELAKVLAGKG